MTGAEPYVHNLMAVYRHRRGFELSSGMLEGGCGPPSRPIGSVGQSVPGGLKFFFAPLSPSIRSYEVILGAIDALFGVK